MTITPMSGGGFNVGEGVAYSGRPARAVTADKPVGAATVAAPIALELRKKDRGRRTIGTPPPPPPWIPSFGTAALLEPAFYSV
jgi:hypothetical protein